MYRVFGYRRKFEMFQTKISESARTLLYSVTILCLIAIAMIFTAKLYPAAASAERMGVAATTTLSSPDATFPGVGVGPIPDGGAACPQPGEPLSISFDVTGIASAPNSVAVSITFGGPNHSYIGDITAQLYSPDGAVHTLFGSTLLVTATGFGDNTDLGATYVFSDNAPSPPSGGWWEEATARLTSEIMTAGTYRTTDSGGEGQVNPAPPTNMNATFAGIPTSNGTWSLLITDGCSADTGAVTAASLTLTAGAVQTQHVADFNGDGKTDYSVARAALARPSEATSQNPFIWNGFENSGETKGRRVRPKNTENDADAPLASPITWYTYINGTGAFSATQWGDGVTDFILTEDFDGDSKSDLTVWRPGPPFGSNFYILQSATNTVRFDTFGQDGDDPTVVADYDGDNKADPAVYRCPSIASPAGQCFFFYRSSISGQIIYNPWGFGRDGDFFPYIGDFDGDGKNDFCIQRTNPVQAGQGQFVMLKSGGGVEYINWGNDSDFLIPGDYDGDGKTDICVRRTVSGNRVHYVLTRTGATSATFWGITGDASVPGDYDGDGKTDFAVWRGSVTPGQTAFYVLNSGSGSFSALQWGQCPTGNCDYAVASWPVH
jgi:subtilisin-like proprotein convertase family protein